MGQTNTNESSRSGLCHRAVIILGIALMTVVGAGQAVNEGLTKINLDALPSLSGGFLLWMAVSYTVVATGFLWVGFVLAKGVPRCLAAPGPPEENARAEHAPAADAASPGAPTSPPSTQRS